MTDTIAEEALATENGASTAPRRRGGRTRRQDGAPAQAGARRGRRTATGGEDIVNSLAEMVDRLIRENQELKRELARAERAQAGGNLGQAARTLSGLQRRVNRALDSGIAGRGRRAAAAPAAPRPRRKVTDPEVLERRRQALAKARAARAAKRQQAAGG